MAKIVVTPLSELSEDFKKHNNDRYRALSSIENPELYGIARNLALSEINHIKEKLKDVETVPGEDQLNYDKAWYELRTINQIMDVKGLLGEGKEIDAAAATAAKDTKAAIDAAAAARPKRRGRR